ncbi:MAG: DUF6056 family protein [Bacteroidia bacterium]
MKKFLNKTFPEAISIFLLVAFLSLFICASFFAHPIADDFSYLHLSSIKDLKTFLIDEYQNWSGRYSSNLMVYFNPFKYGLNAYRATSVVFIILLFIAYFLLVSSLLKENKKKAFIFSLVMLSITLHSIPNTAEGFYWFTGAITYTFASILALIYFALIIYYVRGKYFLNKQLHLFLMYITTLFICGFNEVLTLFLVVVFFIAALTSWYNKENHSKTLFLLFLLSVASFTLVILSPGSANRAEIFADNKDFVKSLSMALLQTLRFLAHFITAPLLIISFLYIGVHRKISETNLIFKQSFYVNRWISLFLLFFIIFIATFLPYYATGILGQHRTVNLAYIFFIPLWFINLSAWINHLRLRTFEMGSALKNSLMFVFFISLFFTSNGYDVINDIAYKKLHSYDKQMSKRYSIIHQHKKDSTVKLEFAPIENPPKTIFVLDIQQDSTHWINEGYRLYFKTNEHIKIKE